MGDESFPRSPRPSNGPSLTRPLTPAGISHKVLSPSGPTGRDDQMYPVACDARRYPTFLCVKHDVVAATHGGS